MTNYQAVERTGGQALVAQLIEEGVENVFGIPGVQLDWAVEALREAQDRIRFVVPRHEQAASYMADGYARSTGREGVCMVVPGPGVLNALSGISTSLACNSRVLMIAGQITSTKIGKGFGLLHELPDQSGVLKSLTKWHGIATRPEDIPGLVHEAFVQLRSGRPRPVAIELPPDVLEAKAEIGILPRAPENRTMPDADQIAQAAALLADARLPVIYAGGGVMASGAAEAVQALAERLQAPVLMTEGGRGTLDDRHPLALTSLGGRVLLPHTDVLLVAGSRFVDGIARPAFASEDCRIVYLNIEAQDMAGPRQGGLAIEADVRAGIEALLDALPAGLEAPSRSDTVAAVRQWCETQVAAIAPQTDYVAALRSTMDDKDILVSELTQVGYYANIAYPVHAARTLITPGYQGTLGYGFNTALGVAVGNPGQRVVSLNGDGGFAWGMQELSTLARDELNLSLIVFVDGRYGNVHRIQKRTFGQTFVTELRNPDFMKLAAAYDIPAEAVDTPDGLAHALRTARERGGPALIAVHVEEMPSPWALIHPFVPPPSPPPPNPLG
ncbi:thiamine pyrophosphate-binding protein [Croceicoccus bisphenolivorans]|uniref:thiamine pyrophosphate-binding protein n=1 Tax=Croceicoccus bisphenolivorans TaxID=1783232 RepID=UPI0008304C97|nr:thiamine pyrophosphate-binding protein [Croceicoccus bisphenolivorans]